MENLKLYFNDAELASALIYAKKKKILNFKEKENDQKKIQKKLLQISQAGFSYDIAKKIINLNDEAEFLKLLESTKKID